MWTRLSKVELRECPVHGAGAFATGDINTGQVISRTRHAETAGPLRFAKQSCRPNARLVRGDVVALRPIRAGDEILLDPDHTLE